MTSRQKHGHQSDQEKKRNASKAGKTVELSSEEYQDLKNRADSAEESRERMMRALADLENIRKRTEKEKHQYFRYANQDFVSELLPVLDNFERALAASSPGSSDPVRQGVEMIYKQLREVLKKQGLEEIKALGERFDPFLHEAVQQEVSGDHPEGTVLEELLKGYMLKGRLLRPSAVKVSQAPVTGSFKGKKPGENHPEKAK